MSTAEPERRLTPTDWGFGPLFDAIKDAVIVADASTGAVLLWNRGAEAMFQYTQAEAAELLLEDLVPPTFKEAHRKGLASYAKHRAGALIDGDAPVEVPALRKDGGEILVELSLSPIANPRDPEGAYAMGLLRDVTALRESELTVRMVLDASPQAMFALDRFGVCTMANRAAGVLLGHEPASLEGRQMHEVMHHSRPDGSPLPARECPILEEFLRGVPVRIDHEVFWRADGTCFPADLQSEPILNGGILLGGVVTFSDITQRRRQEAEALAREQRLRHRAQTDVLTGVGNRRYFNDVLDSLQPGDAVVMLDVDDFKTINDTQGHNAGDEILVKLAMHLRVSLRSGDSLARYGGEEFVLVLRGVSTGAQGSVERMAKAWAALKTGVTFSGGVAVHPDGGFPPETLRRADEAMYLAKAEGRDRVVTHRGAP
jgi:diguanylate cyclase (GGDEF)-like protein/PAS domain S-box-containing protein